MLRRLGRDVPTWPVGVRGGRRLERPGGLLRGLFVGGTLCDEAMLIATEQLGPVRSNIPLAPSWRSDPTCGAADAHTLVDFGDDALHRRPGAPDDRPDPAPRAPGPGRGRPRHRRCCCSTWCSATAPSPTRPRCSAPAIARGAASRWWSPSSAPPHDPQDLDRQVRRAGRRRRRGPPVQRRGPPGAPSSCSRRHADDHPAPHVVTVGADLLADAVEAQAVRRHPRRLAPADARHRGRPGDRGRRPARAGRQRARARRDARRAGDAGRRRPGLGGARPRARPVPARRPADRAGTAPPARCAAR